MGTVFEVRDRERDIRVALKRLRAATPEALLHLKKEFRALQDLRHPNLIRLGELLEEDGRWFFTMELVEGVDFTSWVRPGHAPRSPPSFVSQTRPIDHGAQVAQGRVGMDSPPVAVAAVFDEPRLRDAASQLAGGLGALHRARKVHRDVKPSNVLVTREGRVVLLDFGLATDVDAAASGRHAMGTAAFMAPEVGAGGAPSPASDWYAFGVVLHLALTGDFPFRGAEVERRRAHGPPRPVRDLCPGAPDDLARLCDELLAPDAAARPSGSEILHRLGVREGPPPVPRSPFVGRSAELRALRAAYEESRATTVAAVVVGESGLGKSALARAFLSELGVTHAPRAHEPTPIVLSGRCYEREIVPFNAFDGVVDALSDLLCARDLSSGPTEAPPGDVALLSRVFPVLLRVPAIAELPATMPATPHEQRTRACTALRALLDRITRTQPLILHFDDLQWADADSLWLLDELLTAGSAPRLLVLATLRAPSSEISRLLERLPGMRRVDLGPLDESEARQLAAELVGASGDALLVHGVAREAAGHPLFLQELADYVKRTDAGPIGSVHLDGALWSRVERLDPPARRLIEMLAIAGSPLLSRAAALAADLDAGAYADCAAVLSIERLAHASDAHGRAHIEPYHDRVREAVLGHLTEPERRRGHLLLATALERAGVDDAAQLGRHFGEGGDAARALAYVVRAAEEAGRSLAFEESAGLYERALELRADLAGAVAANDGLALAAAEALSAAGHGKRAAQLFMEASVRSDDLRRIELQRRAAEELFTHGLLDEGYAVLDQVLPALGLSVPRSTFSVVRRVVWSQLFDAIFGHRLRPRTPPASDREIAQVDVIGGITLALWSADPMMGAALQADHLRLALRSGDPFRVAFAFTMEAGSSAVAGVPAQARTRRWVDEARTLLRDHQPDVPGWRSGFSVAMATIAVLECRWTDALSALDDAERDLSLAPLGHSAIRELMTNMRLTTLFWLGRSGDLLRQSPRLLRRADERGNLDSWAWLQTFDAWALSCAGRSDEARERLALLQARLPSHGFLLHRWYIDHVRVASMLCEGRSDEALRSIRDVHRRLRFAPAGQSQRVWSRWLLANAALARALQAPHDRASMLTAARRVLGKLEAERTPWVDGAAACVRASIASVEGREELAARALAQAEPLMDTHRFEAQLACVRAARAPLVGGERGETLRAKAEAWFAEQPFTKAARRMVLPGAWLDAP